MSKSKQNQNENIDTLTKAAKKLDLNSDKQTLDESVEEYTPQELKYLDKYQEYTKGQFEDEDLYDVIIRCNFDDVKIRRELDDMVKMLKKGEEYNWKKVEKGKAVKAKETQSKPEIKVTQKNYNKGNKKNYNDTRSYNKNQTTRQENVNEDHNVEQTTNEHDNDYQYDNYDYTGNYNRNRSYNRNYDGNYYNRNYNRGGYYKQRGRGRSTRYYDRYTEEIPNYTLQIKEVGTLDTNEEAKHTQTVEVNLNTQQDVLKELEQFTEKPLEIVTHPNTETHPKQTKEESTPKSQPKSPAKNPVNNSLIQENIFNENPVRAEEPVVNHPPKTLPKKMEFSISNSNFDIVKANPKQFTIAKESNVFHAQTKQTAPPQNKPKPKVENVPSQEYQIPYFPMPMMMYPNTAGGEQPGYQGYPQMFYYVQPNMMQPEMGEDMKNKKPYQGHMYPGVPHQPGSENIPGHPMYTPYPQYYMNPYGMMPNMMPGMGQMNPMEGYGAYDVNKGKKNEDMNNQGFFYGYQKP